MYDPKDFHTQSEDEDYLTEVLVDICQRSFVIFSNTGEERKIYCDTVEEFMDVHTLIKDIVDEEVVFYMEPVTA